MEWKLDGPAEPVVKRMFYLAWKAVGGPSGIMGCLQDRGEVSEDEVWQNVKTAGDYPGGHLGRERPGHAYGDYVFGRMMKMGVDWTDDTITTRDSPLRIDYEAWCRKYPTYEALVLAAADELGVAAIAHARGEQVTT
jgi:hypothetical protein